MVMVDLVVRHSLNITAIEFDVVVTSFKKFGYALMNDEY